MVDWRVLHIQNITLDRAIGRIREWLAVPGQVERIAGESSNRIDFEPMIRELRQMTARLDMWITPEHTPSA